MNDNGYTIITNKFEMNTIHINDDRTEKLQQIRKFTLHENLIS